MGQARVGVNVGIIETHKERAKAAEGTWMRRMKGHLQQQRFSHKQYLGILTSNIMKFILNCLQLIFNNHFTPFVFKCDE